MATYLGIPRPVAGTPVALLPPDKGVFQTAEQLKHMLDLVYLPEVKEYDIVPFGNESSTLVTSNKVTCAIVRSKEDKDFDVETREGLEKYADYLRFASFASQEERLARLRQMVDDKDAKEAKEAKGAEEAEDGEASGAATGDANAGIDMTNYQTKAGE
ncbi:hypothetical protein SCUCBS95973_001021 [Sporothrix curviconia]|uniref:Uncharacterized protein n=1 Tax=Sporothrix curviconia TaxID=1260050 RepID=A0ABP0AV76_9PEZI